MLDVSSRGLKLNASSTPPRGAYVEICRGREQVVARVIWTGEQRFGVRTQDRVAIEAFVNPERADASATPITPMVERRLDARRRTAAQKHVENRYVARAVEYGSLVGLGGCGAMILFALVEQAFSHPVVAISAALASQ